MTADVIDDLHEAEQLLDRFAMVLDQQAEEPDTDLAKRNLEWARRKWTTYCRPSCGYRRDDECASDDCDCPCGHGDATEATT